MPTKYSQEEAEKFIKEISSSPSGKFIPTFHAEKQRGQTRNFDAIDALKVLRTGKVVSEPTYSSVYKNWKCKMLGEDVEGCELTIVVAFDPAELRVFVITGW